MIDRDNDGSGSHMERVAASTAASAIAPQDNLSMVETLVALSAQRDAILAQLVEGVIITDEKGCITYVNDAAKELHGVAQLGVAPDQYTAAYSLLTEEGAPHPTETLPLVRAVDKHETVVDARWRIRRPDGTEIIASGNARPIYNGDGTIIGSVLTVRDDTKRREAEAALRASETLSRSILEASPDCMKLIDLDGRLVYMNANGCAQMDVENFNSIEGNLWYSWWPPGAQSVVARALAAAAAGNQDSFEEMCLTAKGNRKWWSVVVSPVLDTHKRCVKIIVASRDITKRKESEFALRESQYRTSLAMEASGMGIWEIDLRTGISHWDSKMCEIYGISEKEGGSVSCSRWTSMLQPETAARTEAMIPLTIENGGSNRCVFAIKHQATGEVREIEAVLVSRRNAEGDVEWVIGTNLDVTDRNRLERHNNLLMREVNHRSKNLLSVIQSIARMTSSTAVPEEFLSRFSQRLAGLASSQDLLIKNEWQGIDLRELVESQLAPFLVGGESRIAIEGPAFTVSSAAAQGIGMALHELGTNASKYGSLSNDAGTVRIIWSVEGDPRDTFRIEWREEGGPSVVVPSRIGFGNMVIGRMAEASTEGTVEFGFPEEGFFWKLITPLAQVSEKT